MAHPSKFVSVNLNKSYGQPTNPSYSSRARARAGPHPGPSGTGGGGGMVVLSRSRSSSSSASAQKSSMPKLSVPPPLNLPSLRKENEKFDLLSSSGSSARPGSSGIGSGSGSSSMGWTKPAPALLQDKEVPAPASGRSGSSGYVPLSAQGIGQVVLPSSPGPVAEKAVFLRGEDFPSLIATVTSGSSNKKDLSNQKEKAKEDERERPGFHSPLRMRPQMRSSRFMTSNVIDVDDGRLSCGSEQLQKQQPQQEKYFPGPLPLVKLTHTSDWADDERDTGLSLPERNRGFLRTEFSRVHDRDADLESVPCRELYKGDSYGRGDLVGSIKDGRDVASSWRMPLPSQPRDDRASVKPFGVGKEVNRDSSFSHSPYGNNARDGLSNGNPDSRYTRRDLSFGMNNQIGKNEGFSGRSSEQQNVRSGRYGDFSNNRYRRDTFQQNAVAKAPFSYATKGLPLNDPILNFGREKKLNSSSSGNPYLGDADFDGSDPFEGDPIADVSMKVFKKKKDVQKQADFRDPARESFEAELERVQRIQEQERQRAMEEQARAMEIARREQEERERLVREEEERRRLIEEEAREAAWRAEQDRMEAARRVEEQKIAREEEKRRMLMEEVRRKEAARQKLMELEARIAGRQTEHNQKDDKLPSAVSDERAPVIVMERDILKAAADVGDWEDGERMVEHLTSTSSDSSMNRYTDTSSARFPSTRDIGSSFIDRGKHGNYWKRDAFDNGTSSMFHPQDQDADYRNNLRRDTFSPSRGFLRKDGYGGFGAAPTRQPYKSGASEHCLAPDNFRYLRGNRWNAGGEGDRFTRNLEVDAADFLDIDRFGDGGWDSNRPRGSPNAPYAERSFQNSEVDGGFPSYGRSRHSLRQPRVLPPPSISSMRQSQSSFRGTADRPISSFLDNQSRYQHGGRSEDEIMQSGYDGSYHQRVQQPKTPDVIESDLISSEQKEKDSPRCDSQSSLSVSNPPSSPTQLSHDELDDAEDCQTLQTCTVEEQTVLSDSEHMASGLEVENMNRMATASLVSHGEDDEWAIENNEEMQEQEEYDEEDNGYQEEEEATHDGDGGQNLDLSQEYDDPTSDVPDITCEMGQLVLGFDEGVEVSIPIDDDLEKTSGNLEIAVQEDSLGDYKLQVGNSRTVESVGESSKSICETEKALLGSVLEPVASSTFNPSESSEPTSVLGAPDQQPIEAPLSLLVPSASTVQPISPTISTVDSQTEAPIRLQFGLFSGPSLIPSPVPAIQIGSIQMPLHLHPQVGTSITQMHPPQPPFFQFGQLRYPSPISQGILPLAPQTVSFVHPPASAQYPSIQNLVGSRNNQARQDSSLQNIPSDKLPSNPIEQTGQVTKPLDLPEGNAKFGLLNESSNPVNGKVASRGQTEISGDKNRRQASGYQNDRHIVRDITSRKNYRSLMNNRESQVYSGDFPPQLSLGEKGQSVTRAPGIISKSRGRRFAYAVRNAGARSQFSMPENSRTDSSMFQRRPRRSVRSTQFRVRDNGDKRQREGVGNNNSTSQEARPSFTGRTPGHSLRYGIRKDVGLNKSTKVVIESENAGASSSHVPSYDGKIEVKLSGKEAPSKKRVSSLENSCAVGDNGKRNVISEEDVDAPLQSGVIRIFKQSGIEAPSDEDDFIEVRSKRQMLIDRREQREKEIKAKSKAPRKHRAFLQNNVVTSTPNKAVAALGGNTSHSVRSDPVITGGRGFARVDASPVFSANMTSQTLPPIGTPTVKTDSDKRSINLASSQANSTSVASIGGAKFVPGLTFDSKNTGLVNASLSLGSWTNPDINQQVMALTQSQLDDAMKPVQFDSQVASSITLEPTKPPSSIVVQEKTSPPSANPLNSLLAGERIQFGAVTSPTILPPVSRTVSNGIGPPGSSRLDVSKDNMATTNNDSTIFFDKDKLPDESCPHLDDPESEAEAAASAVAVAAISNNDEIIGNRLSACSIPDSKSFSGADNSELKGSGGMSSSQEVTGQLAAEEPLTVALPADLSVDTPALPLWHPLPSPQSTSGPTLSHFPGGSHSSHFPMGFDMNPIFGGPIFAFGPHDESGGTQSQQQRSTTLGSVPLGAWPQCHSGVDSFYGPPAGFTGPYISPPGGIPGVQAPPHMVVYNHFAPVGQFGQVGLSFMGTTYIPTGKQPDWKHNLVSSSTVGVSEGDMSSGDVSGQCNPPNMPSPIQHLAPGSPLMPMASPLPMFDMSPFQSSSDMPYQARWSHVPAPPMHSVSLTMPLQQQQPQQVEGRMPSQFSRSLPMDTSTVKDRFNDPRSSTSGNGNRSFTIPNDAARQFTDELRLVELPSASTTSVQAIRPSYNPLAASNSKSSNNSKSTSRCSMGGGVSEGVGGGSGGGQNATSSFKPQGSQQQSASSGQQQYLDPIGHGDQRGASQKTGSASEWHRRMGYQGRGQGSDKGFASSKMKQIYVAKSPTSGPATTG